MSEVINEFIENVKYDWQVEIFHKLDKMVYETIPDVVGRLQYRKPHYLKNGKYAAVLGSAKEAASLTIFNATSLEPPDTFEVSDDGSRITIKIRKDQEVDYGQLASLLKQAADTI